MQNLEKLKELFMQFPGIGPRQAGRFLHFLLLRGSSWRSEFVRLVAELDSSTAQCKVCMRFFEKSNERNDTDCSICRNPERIQRQILIVVHDVDIKQIEKGGKYGGIYFVLGSLVPLSNNKKSYARIKELENLIKQTIEANVLEEIIFALPATPDGEYTTDTLRRKLGEIIKEDTNIKMTILGRGLSTGSEIEYADPETINSALKNRA